MRAEGHQPHSARLAALRSKETGPWPEMQEKNETDISGVSKPRLGASKARRPVSETTRLCRPGIRWPRWHHSLFYCTVRPCR